MMMVNTNNLALVDFIMKHFVYICMPFIQKYLHFRRRRGGRCRHCCHRICTIREAEHVHRTRTHTHKDLSAFNCFQLIGGIKRVSFVCPHSARVKRS